MVLLWGMNGFFQSMAWTPGLAALTNWWPGNKRGFATGFAHAFSGFGQAAATLAVTLSFMLLPAQGWRAAFWIPAAFPLVMLLLFLLFTRPAPRSIGLAEYAENDPERVQLEHKLQKIAQEKGKLYPFIYVLRNSKFWLWIAISIITGVARYGLSTWVPLYFVEKFGLDITSGLLQSLTLPVGMGIGTLVVPALTDRFCPQNRLPAVIFSAVVSAVSVAAILFLDPRIVWQRIVLLTLLFIAGFCIYAISGTSWAYATDIGGRVFSGTCSGILDFSAYLGAAVQSLLYGSLLRHLGWSMIFISIAVLCGFTALLAAAGARKRRSIL
jgi:sugar phosphate permease